MSIPILLLGSREVTIRFVHGPSELTEGHHPVQDFFIALFPYVPEIIGGHDNILGLWVSLLTWTLCLKSSRNVRLIRQFQCIIQWVNTCRFCWGSTMENQDCVYLLYCLQDPFSWRPSHFFKAMSSIFKTWPRSGSWCTDHHFLKKYGGNCLQINPFFRWDKLSSNFVGYPSILP